MQLLAFLQGLFTFYHHGYELAKDFSDFKTELTISIQNVSTEWNHLTETMQLYQLFTKDVIERLKLYTSNPHSPSGQGVSMVT